MRSASVDFPWSMWAMIEKLRMWAWSAIGSLQRRARRRPCLGEPAEHTAAGTQLRGIRGAVVGNTAGMSDLRTRGAIAGRRVLITGGSSGIGLACAHAL